MTSQTPCIFSLERVVLVAWSKFVSSGKCVQHRGDSHRIKAAGTAQFPEGFSALLRVNYLIHGILSSENIRKHFLRCVEAFTVLFCPSNFLLIAPPMPQSVPPLRRYGERNGFRLYNLFKKEGNARREVQAKFIKLFLRRLFRLWVNTNTYKRVHTGCIIGNLSSLADVYTLSISQLLTAYKLHYAAVLSP